MERKTRCSFARRVKKDVFAGVWAEGGGRAVRVDAVTPPHRPSHAGFHMLRLQPFSGESTESCWLWCLWVLRKYPLARQGNAVTTEDFKPVSYLKAPCCDCCRGEVDQRVELAPVSVLFLQFRSNS